MGGSSAPSLAEREPSRQGCPLLTLAAELVSLKMDVAIAVSRMAARAALSLPKTLSTVFDCEIG